ncbi:hypothetical protein [Acerihabitans arboris]|uniref:Uncharacterized protein n=1 Tax=Acerihabitans arboris TaxID=2691583 RepID=A0A845SM86_9GAMM|nr:hypothetical protein [Acerihabitans arboris]NDL66030.1 hypothetical protein [Acerihabitans arboris]
MKQKLFSLSLLVATAVVAFPSQAATGSITKSASAQIVTVYSNGTALPSLAALRVASTDFPSGTLNKSKTLTLLSYTVAAYPKALTDSVQLCYYEPYKSSPALCIPVTSGSSGTTTQFNTLTFNSGAYLQVRHDFTGNPGDSLQPSRQESVTWDYSY